MTIRHAVTALFAYAFVLSTFSFALAADVKTLRTNLQQGRYAEVVEQIGETPTDAQTAILLARSLESQGKRDEALAAITTFAKDSQPTAALLAEAARLHFQRGNWEKANEDVKRALALDQSQTLARWLRAELARVQGDLESAQTGYEWFVDYYNENDDFDSAEDLYYVGQAASQYARWTRNSGQFQFLVNDLYPDVLRRDPNFWQAELALAQLFAEKYNMAEAAKHLNKALAINANSADVYAEKGAVELTGYDVDAALRTAELALGINPQHIPAKQVQGKAKLTDFRPEQAIEILSEVVKLNPNDQTSKGYLASAMLAADGIALIDRESGEATRLGELLAQVEQDHPNLGEFYAALGNGCDIVRKYPDAVKYLEQAREKMPQLIGVHGDLGMVLMRMGEEGTAKVVLDEAFEADPFNVRVKNTLEVLDVLATYETIETEHFIIRFDPSKDRLLAVYMSRFLEENVYPKVCEGLGYTPKDKSLIEIFNQAKNTSGHGWFSARMVGLPYIGTVGACAGKMIAMASPDAVPSPYNWAHVIRHEFVHVVNLQQTDFNIPHWFTEALAVSYESEQRPPEWKTLLARRLAEDRVFNLDTINYGFIRPSDQDDWTMAYCQAYYYSQFIQQKFGEDALAKMLAAYHNYQTTDEILKDEFQIDKADFEQQYVEFLKKEVAGTKLSTEAEQSFAELYQTVEEDPQDADAQAQLAFIYLKRKALPDARDHAKKALAADKDQPLAHYVQGRLYLTIGDNEEAIAEFETAAGSPRFERNAVALLAGLRVKQKRFDEALQLYQRGAEEEPGQLDWQESILRIHLLKKDNDALLELIPQIAAQKHHDVLLRKKMAEILLQQKSWEEAARWAYEVIGIQVTDADAHALLAQAYHGQKKWDLAAREFEVAGQLRPKTVSWSVEAAELYEKAGNHEKARKVAQRVLDLDPDNAAAKAILND
ncbi:tetratricopeptide repeat protein [Bremerella volcania]|uniref:Tetratricopeptide repeat protein n=1 Tax=Bremerella volcania TaxID=2527984 RepID=A0A518C670_9BACT|nr:tetratricopeptide repeat protein [Bremerella volcania]QDU74723.1 tetratricopeptide repeat protein [Bremerella volcania]